MTPTENRNTDKLIKTVQGLETKNTRAMRKGVRRLHKKANKYGYHGLLSSIGWAQVEYAIGKVVSQKFFCS